MGVRLASVFTLRWIDVGMGGAGDGGGSVDGRRVKIGDGVGPSDEHEVV